MSKTTITEKGLFRRRGSPNWWIRFADRDGRMRRESTGTPVKKLAREILAKRKTLVAENRRLDVRRPPKAKFFEILDLYWDEKGQFLKMKGLSHMIKIWKRELPNLRAEDLTEARIESFLRSHVEDAKLSPTTRNRHLGQLKAVFNWALNRDPEADKPPLITHNPAAKIKKTDEKKFRRQELLSPAEINQLLAVAEPDFRRFLLTAVHTGMRRGELFNLRWEDVNLRNRLIFVRESKSGQSREIPIDDTLFATLRESPTRFRKGHVFPSPATGGKLTDVKRQFRATADKAKLPGIRLHDLRHAFASHLVMAGVDLKTVSELLGHSTTRMSERYSHLSPAHKTRAVSVLDAVYASGTKTDTVASEPSANSCK